MNKILLIGAGQIGSRHLQSLALLDNSFIIDVLEISLISQETAQERYKIVLSNKDKPKLTFFQKIENLANYYDFVFITTDSKPRRAIIEQLTQKVEIKFLILEKFLFPRLQDFKVIEDLVLKKNIVTYVNTARRMYDFYQTISLLFKNSKNISFEVEGSDWGLACNCIHFIDLFAMITQNLNLNIETDLLENKVYQSKRGDYIEFYGTLNGCDEQNNKFKISCKKEDGPAMKITIQDDNQKIVVYESEGRMFLFNQNGAYEETFKVKYQSELTHLVVKDLIDTENCKLTKFADSSILHQKVLTSLLSHYQKTTGQNTDLCPIT